MKKIWVVLLSVYVTIVTIGCVAFGVLYFGEKFDWWSDGFARTRAEYIEAVDATYKVMNFDDSSASAAAFTDADWEKKDGEEAKQQVAVFRRLVALTKGILENDSYSLTSKVITFHVDQFLSNRLNLKMQFEVDGDNLTITYYMTAEGSASESIQGMQYYTIDINYDFQHHEVRTYHSNFYGAEQVTSCKYAANDGTYVLKGDANGFASFKTQLQTEAEAFNKKAFKNTDYDFSKEFKDAHKDIGNV